MTKTKTEKRLDVAVATLCRDKPYIIKGVLSLRFYKDKTGLVKTMATDKYWRTYYSEEFVSKHSIKTLAEVIYHELCHLIFEHFIRLKDFDSQVANLGGDCEINDQLRKDYSDSKGLSDEFESLAIFPEKLGLPNEKLAEYYCREIEKQAIKVKCQCGSCAHGKKEEWEDDSPSDGGKPGISEIEGNILLDEIAKEIASGKGIGNCPGNLVRWAGERIKSKRIPWTTILKKKLGARIVQGMHNYSYMNRERKLPPDFYFPGPISYTFKVGVIVDTSGSMEADDIGLALDVISKLSREMNFDVTYYAGDIGIATKEKNLSKFKKNIRGGGGTSMENVIVKVDRDEDFDFIICLTDGGTYYPEKRTRADLIVAIINNGSESYGGSIPKWATRIEVKIVENRPLKPW